MERWPLPKREAIVRSEIEDPIRPDWVTSMLKRETCINEPSKARLIQASPNLATQARFGPDCMAIQKAVFGVFNRFVAGKCTLTVASGLNARDLGDWMTETMMLCPDAWFYERDGKNWDSTMNRHCHDLKMSVYRCFPSGFAEFADRAYRVTGRVRCREHLVKYVSDGCTKSGHNDTTLANSLINLAILYEVFSPLDTRCHIIVAGDDALVVVSGDFDECAIARCESTYGIIPEYRKFRDVRHVSFISGCWFEVELGRYLFSPKPGRLFSKLWWTVNPPTVRRQRDYVHSVIAGLLPSCGYLPVVGAWLRMLDQGGELISVSKYGWETCDLGHINAAVVHASFCLRYGFSDRDTLELEKWLLGLGRDPCVATHPLAEVVESVDLADLGSRATF